MTDQIKAAAAIQEYEDAMTELLAHVRGWERDNSDLHLKQRLYAADNEIERQGLRYSPAYNDAVLRADRRAWAFEPR